MKLARVVLILNAVLFAGLGAWCLADPAGTLGPVGVVAQTPHGATELRAMYGGLELGVALFLLLCTRRTAWLGAGLLLCGLALLGLGLTRGLAAVATGTFSGLHPVLVATELGGAALNLWAYRRAPR